MHSTWLFYLFCKLVKKLIKKSLYILEFKILIKISMHNKYFNKNFNSIRDPGLKKIKKNVIGWIFYEFYGMLIFGCVH